MKTKWKTAFVIVLIIAIVIGGIYYYQYKNQNYDFDGIEINRKVFNEMASQFPEDDPILLCRFSDEKCVRLWRNE